MGNPSSLYVGRPYGARWQASLEAEWRRRHRLKNTNVELIHHLPAYHEAAEFDGRFLICYGGAGSGKSTFIAEHLTNRCRKERGASGKRHKILVLRKVARTLRRSVFAQFEEVALRAGLLSEMDFMRGLLEIRLANGSEVIFAGLDDNLKLKSITGVTSVWIEEADEITEDDLDQVDLRLRGEEVGYRQVILSYNPRNARSFLKARFHDQKLGAPLVVHTTWADNPFHGYDLDHFDRIRDANLRKIYERGEWGEDVKNLIYPSETWDTNWPAVLDGLPPEWYGLDIGYRVPTALIAGRAIEGDLYCREIIYSVGLTGGYLIEEMRRVGVSTSIPIWVDAGAADRIDELCGAKFNAKPAKKDVFEGIMVVKDFALHFHPDSVGLQEEAGVYKWEETKDGLPLDVPVKFLDHGMDAMRYGVYSTSKRHTKKPGVHFG